MGNEIATQAQEVQRVPYRINLRINTLRYILIKLTITKFKEKMLKAAICSVLLKLGCSSISWGL